MASKLKVWYEFTSKDGPGEKNHVLNYQTCKYSQTRNSSVCVDQCHTYGLILTSSLHQAKAPKLSRLELLVTKLIVGTHSLLVCIRYMCMV
jgi:hypothetical protein